MKIHVEQPLQVFVDNRTCIALSMNSMSHGKTKHFALKVHFIWNLVGTRLEELNYLFTERKPADNLTKVSLFRHILLGSNT